MKPKATAPSIGVVLGVSELGWMYGRSRYWASALLRKWEREQMAGGPRLVFRQGRALYTTITVVNSRMPPGRDLALYRRVESLEGDMAQAHQRMDLIVTDTGDIRRRVVALERARPRAA